MRKIFLLPFIAFFASCGGPQEGHDHEGHNHEAHEHEEHSHEGHDHESHEHEGHSHEGHDHESHEHEGHSHEAPVEEGHSHEGGESDGEIVLHKEIADQFGVEIDTVISGDFSTSVRVAGIVVTASEGDAVVSAPTAGIVRFVSGMESGRAVGRGSAIATIDASNISGGDANIAAKTALESAKTEYERIEALYKDRLATVGERNAALAAYNAAKAAYSPAAATGRAVSPISGTVTTLAVRQGQYVNAGDVIATIASPGEQTVRIDLPQRYYTQAPTFSDAILILPYTTESVRLSEYGGKRISGTPVAAQGTSAYLPVFFSAGSAPGLVAGTTFSAYLLGAARHDVVSVPNSSLSEQQGDYFVFEQLDEECYAKRRVEIGATDGVRTEIKSGVAPGTKIVSKGVTTIRLAEAGHNIPEGHTHNH